MAERPRLSPDPLGVPPLLAATPPAAPTRVHET